MDLLRQPRLPWPAPALLGWGVAWGLLLVGRTNGWPAGASLAVASGAAVLFALVAESRWRRLLVAAGFPVSLLAAGWSAQLPPWTWLLALTPVLAAYPLKAWRDAPFFPSPPEALTGLRGALALPAAPRVLDAGCGAGHGLAALRRAWPDARLDGVEWSWPLVLAARLRCPWARVRRGDLWAGGWQDFDLVYLFQRPESMGRAWTKACMEMRPGTWLVSLEFVVPGVAPTLSRHEPGGREVHAWRIGAPKAAQPGPIGADNPRRARAVRGGQK